MDFEVTYTEEQERFRAEVRAWFEANLPAELAQQRAEGEVDAQADAGVPKLGGQGGVAVR